MIAGDTTFDVSMVISLRVTIVSIRDICYRTNGKIVSW